jgi:hypothetical protein
VSAAARVLACAALALALGACTKAADPPRGRAASASAKPITEQDLTPEQSAFVDSLERHTFLFFWELAEPATGMMPDRWPTKSFISTGATGFALTAYPIGAERGWITRTQAAERTLRTMEFHWAAPQDTANAGPTGYKGFFYHFLHPGSGRRWEDVELSDVDTGLFLMGALFCQSYFDRDTAPERRIRSLVDSLVARADWKWLQVRPPVLSHGWVPRGGHLPWDWHGYNEAMFMYLLALGSPTHAVGPEAWAGWAKGYTWGRFHDEEYVGFAPLFGHQYSHVWVDFRGIQDSTMRARGIDYFENSRRATYAQRAYAIHNPSGFRDYGPDIWGLTACDGPLSGQRTLAGRERSFHTYEARGACYTRVTDDGTIAPTAAGGSIAFAPEICLPALMAMKQRYGTHVYRRYGFVDSFNPTLNEAMETQHGQVVPGVGWFDGDHLGIDQGPILAMIENWRTGLVWEVMRKNAHLRRGLEAAGFQGGWLESAGSGR